MDGYSCVSTPHFLVKNIHYIFNIPPTCRQYTIKVFLLFITFIGGVSTQGHLTAYLIMPKNTIIIHATSDIQYICNSTIIIHIIIIVVISSDENVNPKHLHFDYDTKLD